jgi:hypothetical protein
MALIRLARSYLIWGVVMQSGLERGFRYFKVSPIKAFRDNRHISADEVFTTGRFTREVNDMVRLRQLRCSFCGRKEDEVSKLVAGPRVYICDQCVALASRIIESDSNGDSRHLEPKILTVSK